MRRSRVVVGLVIVGSLYGSLSVMVGPATGALLGEPNPGSTSAQLSHDNSIVQIELAEAQRDLARQQAESARAADRPSRILLPVLAGIIGTFLVIVLPLLSQRRKDRVESERAAKDDIAQRERESAREGNQRRAERAEAKRAATDDIKQREAAAAQEAAQARKELVQRFDVSFAAAVAAMGDPSHAAQAAGAAAMQSFLRPDLRDFHDQTYLAVRSQLDLRIQHPDAVRSILVVAIAKLLSERCGSARQSPAPRTSSVGRLTGVDLASTWLRRVDLREINLVAADLWHADLRDARLDGACLRRARGWKAKLARASFRGADLEEARFRAARAADAVFSEARLISARFEESVLDGARLRGAKLQSAHFTDAYLRGADFRDAEVRDAHFLGAEFDDETLSSLVLARDLWEPNQRTKRGKFTAHLDRETGERLLVLARRQGREWVPEGVPA
jgi:hypothetical protein